MNACFLEAAHCSGFHLSSDAKETTGDLAGLTQITGRRLRRSVSTTRSRRNRGGRLLAEQAVLPRPEAIANCKPSAEYMANAASQNKGSVT